MFIVYLSDYWCKFCHNIGIVSIPCVLLLVEVMCCSHGGPRKWPRPEGDPMAASVLNSEPGALSCFMLNWFLWLNTILNLTFFSRDSSFREHVDRQCNTTTCCDPTSLKGWEWRTELTVQWSLCPSVAMFSTWPTRTNQAFDSCV